MVFAVTACVYSLLAVVGFLTIAHRGRDAIHDRIDEVLDTMETAVGAGTGSVSISTPDGVEVTIEPPGTRPVFDGMVVVERSISVGGTDLVLVGRAPRTGLDDGLRSLFVGMWIVVPLASVLSAAMAWLATNRALRPVGAISELAATIGAAHTDARVPVEPTGDEIERLGATLNEMLDRIDAGRVAQRRFTSDAAHELRTPLMALMGEIELARVDPSVDAALLDRLDLLAQRLGERVDDLVLLSTLDEGRPLQRTSVAVLDLVRREAAALSADIEVGGDDATVDADEVLVSRACRNLLANAVRHRRSKVTATVSAEAGDGALVWLYVDDDGSGVAPDQREAVFHRFTRLDDSRRHDAGGSGLGLAVVDSVARAHGGLAAVTEGPLGGARFAFALPAAPAGPGGP